jgi:hypothetical protein
MQHTYAAKLDVTENFEIFFNQTGLGRAIMAGADVTLRFFH